MNKAENSGPENIIAPASSTRDTAAEQEFQNFGLTYSDSDKDPAPGFWTFKRIKYNQIDIEKSLKNQARLDTPLIQTHLSILRNNLKKGCKFPAAAGYVDPATGKIVLVDGNHRTHLSQGYEYVNVYIINFPNESLKRWYIETANQHHGLPNSEAVRIQHAINEIHNYGMTEINACEQFCVSRARLKEQLDLSKFALHFSKKHKANTLSETVKRELAVAIDKVTLTVATLLTEEAIKNPNINQNQIKEFCTAYQKCITAEEQQAMMNDIAGRFVILENIKKQKTGGGVVNGRPKRVMTKDELMRQADKLLTVLRLPMNGTDASVSSEDVVRLEALSTSLNEFIKTCKKTGFTIA